MELEAKSETIQIPNSDSQTPIINLDSNDHTSDASMSPSTSQTPNIQSENAQSLTDSMCPMSTSATPQLSPIPAGLVSSQCDNESPSDEQADVDDDDEDDDEDDDSDASSGVFHLVEATRSLAKARESCTTTGTTSLLESSETEDVDKFDDEDEGQCHHGESDLPCVMCPGDESSESNDVFKHDQSEEQGQCGLFVRTPSSMNNISAKAAARLGINLDDKKIDSSLETKPPRSFFKPIGIDKDYIIKLQRGSSAKKPPRNSIHESLERLPQFEYDDTKPPISPQTQVESSDPKVPGRLRNSCFPPEFPLNSPRHSAVFASTNKKNKLGFQFFRPKTGMPIQSKSVQLKELKRMIRAGKPSYEQIHNWGHSFEALLNDKYGLALFKDFLSTEFSDENIEFWIACQDYKQTTNPKKLAMKAQAIFNEFIAVQANREVNLDSKTRLQTEADLSNPTLTTLENAQKRIQALMEKDSYCRFLRSEIYLTLLKEARETVKAAAAAALAASLQEASEELDEPLFQLVHSINSSSPFSFLSNRNNAFNCPTGLSLPGVAAAAAKAEAGMNNIQDLQLLGLATSRHMREARNAASNPLPPISPTSGSIRSKPSTTSPLKTPPAPDSGKPEPNTSPDET